MALGTYLILNVALPAPKGCFLLNTLLNPHLMVGVAHIYLGEDLGEVEAI